MLEHLPKHSEQTSDQHGTFPVSSHQYSGAPGMSNTISNHHRTLKCVNLRFGKYARHRRDTSPTNDHQWDLDGHMDPCAFQKICYRWTVNIVSYFLLFRDICSVRDLIVGIPIPSSTSLPTLAFYSFPWYSIPWPSHKLQLGCNLTEWAQSIFPSRGRTNLDLDAHASTQLHWNT